MRLRNVSTTPILLLPGMKKTAEGVPITVLSTESCVVRTGAMTRAALLLLVSNGGLKTSTRLTVESVELSVTYRLPAASKLTLTGMAKVLSAVAALAVEGAGELLLMKSS